jgi:hypothetical protein
MEQEENNMIGPLDFIAIEFPGNHFKGEIIPILSDYVSRGLIRILDLVFIKKDRNGNLTTLELNEIDKDTARLFAPIIKQVKNMLTVDDIEKIGKMLNNNTSAGLMLFENTWAAKFVAAAKNANGRMIMEYRIPVETVETVLQPMPV